jgi:hypothetical protein
MRVSKARKFIERESIKSRVPIARRGLKRGLLPVSLCLMAYITAGKKFQTKTLILTG